MQVEGEMQYPKTLFARGALTGNGSTTRLRTNLTDIGVYVLSRWVLELLSVDGQFTTINHDLVPYLIRRQFHSKNEPGMSKIASLPRRAAAGRVCDFLDETPAAADPVPLEVCRCFAFIVERADPKRLSSSSVFSYRAKYAPAPSLVVSHGLRDLPVLQHHPQLPRAKPHRAAVARVPGTLGRRVCRYACANPRAIHHHQAATHTPRYCAPQAREKARRH
jgi:hypothetical protein